MRQTNETGQVYFHQNDKSLTFCKLSLKTRGLGKLRCTELRVKADKALFLEILFGW